MDKHQPVAPRVATIERDEPRREGRASGHRRTRIAVAGIGFALAGALAACAPGASNVPLPSVNVSGLPSINASAVASVAAQAGLAALDQVDTAITANATAAGLTTDESTSLTQLTSALRSAIQSGDTAAVKTALTNLTAKADSFATKLSGTDAGKQITAALASLKAALPSS